MNITITRAELVNYSGIKNSPDFDGIDYALPMNKDGTFPCKGLAVSVYRGHRIFPEIIPLSNLAKTALSHQGKVDELIDDEEEKEYVIEQLKEIAKWEADV